MRLIDADALKEEVNKKKVVGRFNTLLLIDNALTIDNTPIVKQFTIEERPTGEWIRCESGYIMCPFCKTDTKHGTWWKYCPNCGAKMRG